MSTADLTSTIRARLDAVATAAQTAAEALDSNAALDLPEGVLAGILAEVVNLDGRLDLALDRLAEVLDPVTRMAPAGCER
jgi:hypothetical protein